MNSLPIVHRGNKHHATVINVVAIRCHYFSKPHTFYNVSLQEAKCIAHVNKVLNRPRPFILCPAAYAQRPLDTKLLLKEKLVSELLCFPQAPNGTTMIVLLSSEPY